MILVIKDTDISPEIYIISSMMDDFAGASIILMTHTYIWVGGYGRA